MALKYGDYDEFFCDMNRNIKFEFVCNRAYGNDDGNYTNMLMDAKVFEEEGCATVIRFESINGCPTECPRDDDGDICSGQGSCGYDQRESTAKCFCYSGLYYDVNTCFCSYFYFIYRIFWRGL